MTDVTIRRATENDLPCLIELYDAFTRWFARIDPDTPPADLIKLQKTLQNACFGTAPHLFALIAEAEGKAMGFALFSFGFWADSQDATLVLSTLYSKGSGAGSCLMDRLEDIARDKGCGRLMWNVWDQNAPAIEFYQKRGARMISDEPFMYVDL